MVRRPTIFDRRHGKPPGVDELIQLWNNDLVHNLLDIVWKAYDEIHTDFLSKIPWDEDYDDLERSITQALASAIQQGMNTFLPFVILHAPLEHESRAGGKAQPPEYDLAFVWRIDPRVMWPLEAKVFKTDKNTEANLSDYIDTFNGRYLTCKYAPFSPSGAMLGYLKSGDPTLVFNHIESRLRVHLIDNAKFSKRTHKTSDHVRTVPVGQPYPVNFQCHHLILVMGNQGS